MGSELLNLRALNFDDMYLLMYLYEGKSFTQSARLMNLSQAAISGKIKKIQGALYLCLIDRSSGKPKLNDLGMSYGKLASDTVKAFESLMACWI